MTAIRMNFEQQARGYEVARQIGQAIRTEREARGESIDRAALEIDSWPQTVGHIERGDSPNLKLGNIVKLLDRYNLDLVIVPKNSQAAPIAAEA